MTTTPLHHKILACLLAGLVSGAGFHRIATRFLGEWIPPFIILALAISMLVVALTYIIIWQRREQRGLMDSASAFSFWQSVIRFAVAFDLSLFGWQKIFKLQFFTPMGMLDEPFSNFSGSWLTWSYFGHSYPMIVSIGICQMTGSYLLLFSRTRLLGIFIIIPVLLNIFLIDIFYDLGLVSVHAFFMLAAVLYLLLSEYDRLMTFFLRSNGTLPLVKLKPNLKTVFRLVAVILPLVLIAINKSPDKNPQLTGKYVVQKIKVNNIVMTPAMNCDSILHVVYLDISNDCVLEFRDHKQRLYGIYDYSKENNRFSVTWHYPKNFTEKLEGSIFHSGDKRLRLVGKLGKDMLDAELLKVK